MREASIEGGHRAANVAVPVLAEATAVTEHGERPDVAGGAFQRSVRRRIWGVEEDPRLVRRPAVVEATEGQVGAVAIWADHRRRHRRAGPRSAGSVVSNIFSITNLHLSRVVRLIWTVRANAL